MSRLDKLLSKTKKLHNNYSKGNLLIKCLDGLVLVNTEAKTIKKIDNIIDDMPIRQMYISSNELSFKQTNYDNDKKFYITPIDNNSLVFFIKGICNKDRVYETTIIDIINYKIGFDNISSGLIKKTINEMI